MNPLEPAERTTAPDGRPAADQPAWRQDFPIDAPQDQYLSRRGFTRFLMAASAAFGWVSWASPSGTSCAAGGDHRRRN